MSDQKELKVAVPGEWALEKILGPTLDEIGKDIALLYKVGVEKIAHVAKSKTPNIEDGAKANLRVARDVFFNGSFTDEQINAEYFGGILASSRSADGKDDKAIFFLDIIKSLSSSQLKLHYIIYSSLNQLLNNNQEKKDFNPARSDQVGEINIFFLTNDLSRLGVNVDSDFLALNNRGLIADFEYSNDIDPDKIIHRTRRTPTTLGIQLYVTACNMFDSWRKFSTQIMDNFENIEKPMIATDNAEELLMFPPIKTAIELHKQQTKSVSIKE